MTIYRKLPTSDQWKQMAVAALLVVCYPLIWLYFKAKDERARDEG